MGLLWHLRSLVHWEISVLSKKLRFEYTPRSQKTTKHGTTVFPYFFPFTFFHLLILKSQTATGLNMTDNCCTFFAYIFLLPRFFCCYKDVTNCAYCCSFTGMLGFGFNSWQTGAFYYCHIYSTQKPRSNCCRNRILFSYSYQDWGTHTWQE